MNFQQRRDFAAQTSSLSLSLAPGTEFNVEAPEPRKSKRDYRRNEVLCTGSMHYYAIPSPLFFPPIAYPAGGANI